MEITPQDKSLTEFGSVESAVAGGVRAIRMLVQRVFQDPRLQSADAPISGYGYLRPSIAEICGAARQAGLRAEQLLVLVKDVWAATPTGTAHVRSLRGDERLNFVITACVDEFYGPEDRLR